MAFEIKFTPADYNEEVQYMYNEKGTRYRKSNPTGTSNARMIQAWWDMMDEENSNTIHYEGF